LGKKRKGWGGCGERKKGKKMRPKKGPDERKTLKGYRGSENWQRRRRGKSARESGEEKDLLACKSLKKKVIGLQQGTIEDRRRWERCEDGGQDVKRKREEGCQ